MLLRRQALVVFPLALTGCADPTVSDRRIDVTLTVDRTVFAQGDTARVDVTAVNRSERSVMINAGGCPPAFTVIGPDGTVAIPGPQTCTAIAVTRELLPGETYMLEFAWRLDANGRPLGPGTYKLQGRVFGKVLRAESSPVDIRVQAD